MNGMIMTRTKLRNWYAGMAINNAVFERTPDGFRDAASYCFNIAEAMVKESERREEKEKRSETNNE